MVALFSVIEIPYAQFWIVVELTCISRLSLWTHRNNREVNRVGRTSHQFVIGVTTLRRTAMPMAPASLAPRRFANYFRTCHRSTCAERYCFRLKYLDLYC